MRSAKEPRRKIERYLALSRAKQPRRAFPVPTVADSTMNNPTRNSSTWASPIHDFAHQLLGVGGEESPKGKGAVAQGNGAPFGSASVALGSPARGDPGQPRAGEAPLTRGRHLRRAVSVRTQMDHLLPGEPSAASPTSPGPLGRPDRRDRRTWVRKRRYHHTYGAPRPQDPTWIMEVSSQFTGLMPVRGSICFDIPPTPLLGSWARLEGLLQPCLCSHRFHEIYTRALWPHNVLESVSQNLAQLSRGAGAGQA
jgi:hypothetical protein